MKDLFHRIARQTAHWVGSAWAFTLALASVIAWAVTGPIFDYSEAWQLVINTSTTIVTFLVVFLIQNTQNRDTQAVHLKLDEIIRSIKSARNSMIDLDRLTDEQLTVLEAEYQAICEEREEEAEELLEEEEGQ